MSNRNRVGMWVLGAVVLAGGACGDDAPATTADCDPAVASTCGAGLVCEQLGESRHACLPPVLVSGRVIGALDGAPVVGATVVGLDANGAARTRVARTAANGTYALPVSVPRDAEGAPRSDAITLRVAAADHQPFPSAPRTALPIALEDAELGADRTYQMANAATEVALIPLAPAQRGGATVTGTISGSAPGGVLVVGAVGDAARATAVSDLDGGFVLFNVPPGALRVEGYRAGLGLVPTTLEVPAAGLTGVTVAPATTPLATVSGSLSIVNAPGGLTTSVILAVASTFDASAARGEAPAGLRATGIGGAFRIENVPAGRYAVLAAFENDQLVRDPDQGIGGTDVVFVDVGTSGGTVSLAQGFKVTEALAVTAPGGSGIDTVARGPIALSWRDDSSEDGYLLRVHDALGNLVHENAAVPAVTGASTVSYTLDGAALTPGMLYQLRAYSFRERQGGRTFISATEDLRGVFQVAR
ncbi:MAG: hypothetical protein ABW252_02150 [Polyangiales bacterium]